MTRPTPRHASGQMVPRWSWPLVAVLAVMVTVITVLPAAWLAPLLSRYSSGQLRLFNATGSLWHGQGRLALQGDPSSEPMALPGELRWRLSALSLLTVQPRIKLEDPDLGLQALDLRWTWAGLQVPASSIKLPLSLIDSYGAPWTSLHPTGDITVDWGPINQQHGYWNGHWHMQLEHVATALTGTQSLGPFQIDGHWDGPNLVLSLSTLAGPLQASGQGVLDQHGLRWPIRTECRQDCPPALSSLLQLLPSTPPALPH